MDIREVISFYHTARLRSVSKAAAYLQLGQPTVTTHLQRLEKEFGIHLFDRIKRPIRLTADGTAFFEMSAPIVMAVEQGMENLKVQMDFPGHRGSFTIGAYSDLARRFLPQIIKQYRDRNPDTQIRMMARTYVTLMEMLDAGEIDFALVHAPERDNNSLYFQRLFDSPFVLLTPLEHPLLNEEKPSLSSIAPWPFIMPSPRSRIRRYFDHAIRDAGLDYNIEMEMEPTELIKTYVELGMGITVTQELVLGPEENEHLGIIDLSYLFQPAQIGVVTQRGKFLPRSASDFINALLKWVNQSTPDLEPDKALAD